MVLGDAYLQATGEKNARVRLEHQADHEEYLVWKTRLLPQLFQGKPVRLRRVHPGTKRTYLYVRQQSNATPYVGALRRLFYPNGTKRIPADLPKLLKSDIGFAVWFYDDGYYFVRDQAYYLYLGRVTREDARIAQHTLRQNFHLATTILDKKQKGFVLYFPASERTKVSTILQKYIVPVMKYKISS